MSYGITAHVWPLNNRNLVCEGTGARECGVHEKGAKRRLDAARFLDAVVGPFIVSSARMAGSRL